MRENKFKKPFLRVNYLFQYDMIYVCHQIQLSRQLEGAKRCLQGFLFSKTLISTKMGNFNQKKINRIITI